MESKKMIAGLVLIAAFAFPALAKFERDVITPEAVQAALQTTSPNSNIQLPEEAIATLTGKTVVSQTLFEEALLRNAHRGANGVPCGESCVYIPCTVTALLGCSCKDKVCYKNSLAGLEKDVITPQAVQAVLEKTNSNVKLTKDAINALTGKTLVSQTMFAEALLMAANHGVNGTPCGESCVYIPCTVTALLGCSCKDKVCYKNSLAVN